MLLADFSNLPGFRAINEATGHEPQGDFAAASQHLMETMTVRQLLVLSQLDTADPLRV